MKSKFKLPLESNSFFVWFWLYNKSEFLLLSPTLYTLTLNESLSVGTFIVNLTLTSWDFLPVSESSSSLLSESGFVPLDTTKLIVEFSATCVLAGIDWLITTSFSYLSEYLYVILPTVSLFSTAIFIASSS